MSHKWKLERKKESYKNRRETNRIKEEDQEEGSAREGTEE